MTTKTREQDVRDAVPIGKCIRCGNAIYQEDNIYCKKCLEELLRTG